MLPVALDRTLRALRFLGLRTDEDDDDPLTIAEYKGGIAALTVSFT